METQKQIRKQREAEKERLIRCFRHSSSIPPPKPGSHVHSLKSNKKKVSEVTVPADNQLDQALRL